MKRPHIDHSSGRVSRRRLPRKTRGYATERYDYEARRRSSKPFKSFGDDLTERLVHGFRTLGSMLGLGTASHNPDEVGGFSDDSLENYQETWGYNLADENFKREKLQQKIDEYESEVFISNMGKIGAGTKLFLADERNDFHQNEPTIKWTTQSDQAKDVYLAVNREKSGIFRKKWSFKTRLFAVDPILRRASGKGKQQATIRIQWFSFKTRNKREFETNPTMSIHLPIFTDRREYPHTHKVFYMPRDSTVNGAEGQPIISLFGTEGDWRRKPNPEKSDCEHNILFSTPQKRDKFVSRMKELLSETVNSRGNQNTRIKIQLAHAIEVPNCERWMVE